MKKILTLLVMVISVNMTNAQLKKFYTSELYFGCPSPAEEFHFTWDEASGKVTDFYWNHGGAIWFLHKNASTIVRDTKTLYDYDVYLNVTTKGYEGTAYQIRGKLTLTAARTDGAVFGGLWEGTGVYWMGANGVFQKK